MRWFVFLGLAGCWVGPDRVAEVFDKDEDGFLVRESEEWGGEEPFDCDDENASVHPNATEVCDEIDNNCDDHIDDGDDRGTYYEDADDDGYGDADRSAPACTLPSGFSELASDCDDGEDATYPGADEKCDGDDNDCDDDIDEEPVDGTLFYLDLDSDDFGVDETAVSVCEAPGDDWVTDGGDCDDGDDAINPEADEVCTEPGDDPIDENCNDVFDDSDPDIVPPSKWYRDDDGDGYGDPAIFVSGDEEDGCSPPSDAYVMNDEDCDDTTAAVYHGADEICDELDNDCDGAADDDDVGGVSDPTTWYPDSDDDGYGDETALAETWEHKCDMPDGFSPTQDDCDDAVTDTHPGANEVCNGTDDDCDGFEDNDPTNGTTWHPDADGDGFGDEDESDFECDAPVDEAGTWIEDGTDCDDDIAEVNPDEIESCNAIDDNCDDVIDTDAWDRETYWPDADGDSYGDEEAPQTVCDMPTDFVMNGEDCDDANADVKPGATEVCNGIDDDCDEVIPAIEDDLTVFYVDGDSDGYGTGEGVVYCETSKSGYATLPGDCADSDPLWSPLTTEICSDEIDQDCDGEDLPCFEVDVSYGGTVDGTTKRVSLYAYEETANPSTDELEITVGRLFATASLANTVTLAGPNPEASEVVELLDGSYGTLCGLVMFDDVDGDEVFDDTDTILGGAGERLVFIADAPGNTTGTWSAATIGVLWFEGVKKIELEFSSIEDGIGLYKFDAGHDAVTLKGAVASELPTGVNRVVTVNMQEWMLGALTPRPLDTVLTRPSFTFTISGVPADNRFITELAVEEAQESLYPYRDVDGDSFYDLGSDSPMGSFCSGTEMVFVEYRRACDSLECAMGMSQTRSFYGWTGSAWTNSGARLDLTSSQLESLTAKWMCEDYY